MMTVGVCDSSLQMVGLVYGWDFTTVQQMECHITNGIKAHTLTTVILLNSSLSADAAPSHCCTGMCLV